MISVVVTTYNSTTLHHCLEGFRRQTKAPAFEVVVVNDGGKRPELEPAGLDLKIVDLDPPSSNFRLAESRNLGAATSRYDHLVFTDQDCIPAPDFLYRHAQRTQGLTAGCRRRLPLGTVPRWPLEDLPWRADDRLMVWRATDPEQEQIRLCFGCNLGLPRRLFNLVGGFDAGFVGWGFEDLDFAARLYRRWVTLAFDPRIAVYHLDHPVGPERDGLQVEANRARYLRSVRQALQRQLI